MDYAALAEKVADKILSAGRLLALRRTTVAGGDPTQGDPGTPTTVDYPVWALEEELTVRELSSLARIYGSDVCMNDKRFMVAALQSNGQTLPAPTTADQLVDGDKVYNIAYPPRALQPGTAILYYEIQARGG